MSNLLTKFTYTFICVKYSFIFHGFQPGILELASINLHNPAAVQRHHLS